MWYLDHFRLTPFEDRYLNVPFPFMEYAYARFYSTMSYSDSRDIVLKQEFDRKKKEKEMKELSEQLELFGDGFEAVQKADILKAFEAAGG